MRYGNWFIVYGLRRHSCFFYYYNYYSLAATRRARGTATLAAPIIKSIELTASQCLAASNPAHVTYTQHAPVNGIRIHDDQGTTIVVHVVFQVVVVVIVVVVIVFIGSSMRSCSWEGFQGSTSSSSSSSSSSIEEVVVVVWLFCVAFCVCANCRDSGIDYTSNNNKLSKRRSKEETIIRKYG